MEIKLTSQNFEKEVINSDIPVLVDFWATWCGPCKMMAPVLEEIADEYDGVIKVGKVNVDEERELSISYNIESIPTLFMFKNGEIVDMSVGYIPKDELVKKLGLQTV